MTKNRPLSPTYDELNEVTREDNQVLNKSIVYTYDTGGNLLNKTEYPYTTDTLGTPTRTYNYSYGNSNWKDELTGYDGNSVTYDAIGNPLTYNGWTYTWEEGRQLSGMSNSGTSITCKYNDDGIRTQKTVNGVTTKYHLVGDTVTSETNGTDTINYTYDADGDLVSMNLNGTEYYYIYDGVGNIIGLFDSTGTQVVSYTYDTWGKLISITGSLAGTVGVKNPYRYHGYRYDTETGLYYLQSRYYNPEWGRFINADAIAAITGELLSTNMFAYCMNNPASMHDDDGDRPIYGYGIGYETDEEMAASFAAMKKANSSNIMYSKTQHSQRDSGLRNVSDDAVHDRARDKSLSPQERRRYQTEEKYRDMRNTNKRKQKYHSKIVVNLPTNEIVRRTILVVGGALIIGGTLVHNGVTGGLGIVDNGITISMGLGMVIKAFSY